MRARPRGRAVRGLALAAVLLAAGCRAGHAPPPAASPPTTAAASPVKVRVIEPRHSPRVPLRLEVQAELEGAGRCRIRAGIRARQPGPAWLEFVLPEGVRAVEGSLRRQSALGPGEEAREEITVEVPAGGHRLVAVIAGTGEGSTEAYVEFGEAPTPAERGLRIRTGSGGEPVLRIGPEELGR